jgi:hypothetical protein
VSESDRRSDTLIASVSERVREMAESTVEDCRQMLRQAEADGQATREAAEQDAERAREGLRQVGDMVTELADAVSGLHARLEEMATRVDATRADLEARFPSRAPVAAEPVELPEPRPPEPAQHRSHDVGAARLLALNMALNGMEREELDRHIAELFDIDDRTGLLDDVYSRGPLRGHR